MGTTTISVKRVCPGCGKVIEVVEFPECPTFMGANELVKGKVIMKKPCSECTASVVFKSQDKEED